MDKYTTYFGIDINKDVFDVTDSKGNYNQFENKYKGFKKFLKLKIVHLIVFWKLPVIIIIS